MSAADRDGLAEKGEGSALPAVLSSQLVYAGRVVSMRVDEIALPQGGAARREVIEHPGAVVVVALDDEDRVYLVRQYRHAVRRFLLELPAGTLEPGEEPLAAAQRELREEVGLEAREWKSLGSFFSSPGFANEHLHAFVARDLIHTARDPDEDEDIAVVRYGRGELLRHLDEIPDAKSLAALLLLHRDAGRGTSG
jgi:8-oxo-dGTP pyrophosphatase MutT (NUDIX family)